MSGDYLWDKSGPRDPGIVDLERTLSSLRQTTPPPALHLDGHRQTRRWQSMWFVAVAAAAVIALVAVVYRGLGTPAVGFDVRAVSGTPTIGAKAVSENGSRLSAGRWLETGSDARAAIDIADIGRVDVDPGSRLGLISTRPGDYRLNLSRGTLHALIWAPPGQFSVETPSSTTVDLGCAYTLTVGDDGAGLVKVTTGWVGFEWQGRESFIPAGAVCVTRPALGPGTPYFDDVSDAFRAAIDVIDAGNRRAPTAEADRRAALETIVREARDRDVVTLWHLVGRVRVDERDLVFDALAKFVAPPAGVTREGIRDGNRAMRDAWWDRLGLGTTTWWRTWKQQWRDRPGDRPHGDGPR